MNWQPIRTFLWLVLFLVGLEFGLEIRAHRRGWNSLLFDKAIDSVARQRDGSPDTQYGPRDDFPFRGLVTSEHRTSNTLRIWVASASHAEDIYTDVEKIFPSRLRNQLADFGIRAEVLNASRSGLSISENIEQLKSDGPRWNPDVAILYQMSTDIVTLSKRYLRSNKINHDNSPGGEPSHGILQDIARVAEETSLFSLTKANLTPLVAAQRVLASDLPESAAQDYVSELEQFVEVARKIGVIPVLCTFATSVRSSRSDLIPADVRQFTLRFNQYLAPIGWMTTIDRFNTQILDVAKSSDVLVIDLDRQFTGHPELFRDFVHFSVTGHDEIAGALAEAIAPLAKHSRTTVMDADDTP